MTVAEATRQFQDALEARRRTRTMFAGIVSARDELESAATEVKQAYRQLERIRADYEFARIAASAAG